MSTNCIILCNYLARSRDLKVAKTTNEFRYLMPSAARILYRWQDRLRKRQIDARHLILSIQSHVGAGNYQSRTQQAQAAQSYLDEGNEVQPGQVLKYIVRNDKRRMMSGSLLDQ